MEFIALLSSGKGTWGQVSGLVKNGEWDKIIFVAAPFFKSKLTEFDFSKGAEIVTFNPDSEIKTMVVELKEKLKEKIKGTEVALCIASGSGKEHMALISSLIQIPVGIRFVALTKDGIARF